MQETLVLARAGDEDAFRGLTAPYLRELHLHCYRMVGSVTEADDLLQETLLSAWSGLGGYSGDGARSLRAWLYRIATTRCLNAIRTARRRPQEPIPPFEPPAPSRRGEVTWLQPYPNAWLDQLEDRTGDPAAHSQARETVELAFIVALQRLPPRQTATLLLCDVLGFRISEVASMLATGPNGVKGLLQRARAAMAQGVRSDGNTGRGSTTPGSREEQILARRFADALVRDDVDGVVALLTDDAWLAMPPASHEYLGRAEISGFLRASASWRGTRKLVLRPAAANGQPAFDAYFAGPDGTLLQPAGFIVLTLSNGCIGAITRFLDADLQRRLGEPSALGQSAGGVA